MIALDAMGGDNAPHAVIDAALRAAQNGIPILLCGPAAFLEKLLSEKDEAWHTYPLKIRDASEQIDMDEEPVSAVRKKPHSSLVVAVQAVAQGAASHVISAGNSGALVVASSFILGKQEGVDRPAIAGFLPTRTGFSLVLDLGANTEVRAPHLLQFAYLGALFFMGVTGAEKPRVGLLSNGHEDRKGSTLTKEAFELLRNTSLNFVGNVEPYQIFGKQEVDVVVCDGFSGNILLKTMEASCSMAAEFISSAVESSSFSSSEHKDIVFNHYSKALTQARGKIDPSRFGGALVLGVNGAAFVCHGSADACAIENAVLLAFNGLKDKYGAQKTVQD